MVIMVSYLVYYDTLLQITTDSITKCNSYLITKFIASLLQNASSFLLQNASVLLQNAIVITKCDVYYKISRYIVDAIVSK